MGKFSVTIFFYYDEVAEFGCDVENAVIASINFCPYLWNLFSPTPETADRKSTRLNSSHI